MQPKIWNLKKIHVLTLMPLNMPPRGPFSSSSSERLLATSAGDRLSGRCPGLNADRDMAASVIMSCI